MRFTCPNCKESRLFYVEVEGEVGTIICSNCGWRISKEIVIDEHAAL